MQFQICCDRPSRLRLRFGKYLLTKEQCYGLSDLLLSLQGVTEVHANEANGSFLILYEQAEARDAILETIRLQKRVDIPEGTANDVQKQSEIESQFKNKLLCLCLKHTLRRLLLPAQIHGCITWIRALPFLRRGVRALFSGRMTVELLDATAIGTALCCGKRKTASSTMFLLKLSDLLLEYANARAKHALAQSLAIRIDQVWQVVDGVEVQVPMRQLHLGDVIRVRTGSMLPVDGTIVRGDALLNEATMTGEPLAVHKTTGGTVFAGTILEEGEVDIAVRALGGDSRIAKIIDMIDTGEEAKANIQGKAERLADGIVPVSFGLFAMTLLLTRSVSRAISVLMVDFSCAIKLTTPITIISALKEASQHNIVVKGGKYLELLDKVDTIVFDKTGTLTNAVPKVSRVLVLHPDYTEDKVLRIAACLEEHFPHSVAMAVVAEAAEKELLHPEDHETVEYIVAHGIASSYQGKRSIIGSYHFIFEDEGIPFPTEQSEQLQEAIGQDSAIYLAVDGALVGVICINDPPRAEAKDAIAGLRQAGIAEIMMITGDSEANAKYVSESLGLDRYFASVLPDGKAEHIRKLKAEGKTILMVGDGINDTPALSCADVSLTLHGSSDIAREVADISILSDNLCDIVTARRLASAMMAKISQHYRFIVGFNALLILAGIGGVLQASQSACLHNASTVTLAGISTRSILPKKQAESEAKTSHETA